MADFTALKTAIQNAIKQNGNEEITGAILQEILLAVVSTLGDSAIDDLVTALSNEVTNRQNADGTLQSNINAEQSARQLGDSTLQSGINNERDLRIAADTALGTRIDNEVTARENADTALSNRITAITDAIDNGYVYAGIATTSTEPATGKVFYLTTATGVFTNFGGITDTTKGIKILKKVGSTWTSDTVIVMDDTPTENSTNLVKSGGVYASIASVLSKIAEGYLYVGIATAATNPSTPTTKVFYIAVAAGTYTNFLDSGSAALVLTQGINILKYNGTAWSVEQVWGVDDEPTAGSDNLVKSGGVATAIQNNPNIGYFVCDTAAGTAAKTVSSANYILPTAGGGCIKIKMTNANTAASGVTLKIGSADAKPLYYAGQAVSASNTWKAGETIEVYYDGTNYQANNVAGGSGSGVYDISAEHSGTTYANLAAALGTNGANVPSIERKGGMRVKFIKAISATYNVIKTEDVEEAPSGGTLLESAPSIESGTYFASQLSAFATLPESTSAAAVVYYVAVTVDETTTYTTWSITMASADAQEYEQWRYMGTSTANADFVKVADWQGVDENIVKNSRNLITSGAIANLIENYPGEPYLRIGVKMNDNYYIKWDGSVAPLTGYAVSDLIDISTCKDKELLLIHASYSRDVYAYYFYDDNGVAIPRSGVNYAPSYLKIQTIPSNAKYIRVSGEGSGASVRLYVNDEKARYSYQEISDNIKVCLDTFHKIGIKTENIWGGSEEHCFVQSAEEPFVAVNRFFKLDPHIYTKIKTGVRANSSKDLVFYHCDPEIGNLVVPFHTETLVNDTDTDAVIEKNVLLDFSNEECLTVQGEISGTPALNPAYAGKTIYRGTISSIMTKNTYDTAPSTGSSYLGISMDYIADNNNNNNIFFKNKRYVAYGDSITVSAGSSYYSPYVYPRLIGEHFKLELINRGVSGSKPIISSNLSDANLAAVDEDTMLVTISGGQNGWITAEDINSTDRSTSIGAINYYIDQIRAIQPKCLIVLCPTYIGEGNSQCAIDYTRIAENKHVGLAPTLNLNLIDWEYDKIPKVLRHDNVHLTEYGGSRFAAVCIKYIENMIL